jgi:hypothetical protein
MMDRSIEPKASALLLIACSRRKSPILVRAPAWDLYDARPRINRNKARSILVRAPAWDLYDGRLYQVLKKALRDRKDWDREIHVLIVSAKYGVIRSDLIIESYEERMTTDAAELRRQQFSDQLKAAVAGHSFRSVRVDLGRAYRSALLDLDALFAPIPVEWAAGGIGVRNARTRRWILEQLGDPGPSFIDEIRGQTSSRPGSRNDSHP